MVSRFDFNNEGNDRRKGIKNNKKEQVSGAKKNNPERYLITSGENDGT